MSSFQRPMSYYKISFKTKVCENNDLITFPFTAKKLLEKDSISPHCELSDGIISFTIKNHEATGYISLNTPLFAEQTHVLVSAIFRAYSDFENITTKSYTCEVYNDTRYDACVDYLTLSCHDNYWVDVMNNKPSELILSIRLATILRGFYLDHCLYKKETPSKKGLISFATEEDRCYGTKAFEAGVLFNLGLDPSGVLTYSHVPEIMEEYAQNLHKLALKQLRSN